MCGLTFTSCLNEINKYTRVNPNHLIDLVNYVDKNNKISDIEKLFISAQNYKSDFNFLNYFNNYSERKQIKLIVKELSRIIKKPSYYKDQNGLKKIERLKDISWFLDDELSNRYKFVSNFSNSSTFPNSSIIFLKTLNSIINSNNLVEMRGRDSLGIHLNIRLNKNKENLDWLKENKFNSTNFLKIDSKNINFSFIFKYFNIYGSLGENASHIIQNMKNNKLFINFLNYGKFENILLIAHTRWASVGLVNNRNTHPLVNVNRVNNLIPTVFASMNGDIYNYKSILNYNINKYHKTFNTNTTSDTLALSSSFTNLRNFKNNNLIKNKISKIEGSFVGVVTSDIDFSKLLVIKKGNLGLYYGMNRDRTFFSSDVYGLVEDCASFQEFNKDSFSVIDLYSKTKIINSEAIGLRPFSNKNIKPEKIIITSRDISKKNYDYYLEKEISETNEIVQKTLLKYIDFNNKDHNTFLFDGYKKFQKIISRFSNGQLNKIIITGMGTCHTASEAIANFFQRQINKHNFKIDIKSTLASEASAFDMLDNMRDTLIIAIAQSGTTKDTNTFIQMAKKRNASTIALLNKRNGDISNLVDETLYIGDGRDIEIAVPSTKTYVAHLVLGYIISLYFIERISKNKLIDQNVKYLKKLPFYLNKCINDYNKINLDKVYEWFLTNKNWYILYDNKSNRFASMEIRIKLSECCYHSLPYFNIDDINILKIQNSILVYNIEDFTKTNIDKLIKISNKNKVLLFGPNSKLKKFKNTNSLQCIGYDSNFGFLSTVPNVINGQLLSYNIAKHMDKRSLIFDKLYSNIDNLANKKYLVKEKYFCHYPTDKIKQLNLFQKKRNINNLKILKATLKYLSLFSKRPIDTIKHQAKTITVGTERLEITSPKKIKIDKFKNKLQDNSLKLPLYKTNFDKFLSNLKYNEIIILCSNKNIISNIFYDYISLFCKKIHLNNKITYQENYNINLSNHDKKLIIEIQNSNLFNNNFFIQIHNNSNSDIMDIFTLKNEYPDEKNQYFIKINKIFYFINLLLLNSASNKNKELILKRIKKLELDKQSILSYVKKGIYKKNIRILDRDLKNINNVKFLGGSCNLNFAGFLANILSFETNRIAAFDSVENHKHIDMSAEPLLIILLSNIENYSYLYDVYSEIEKFSAHNNKPIIIKDEKTHFEKISSKNSLITPSIQKEIGILLYLKIFEMLYYKK